MFFIKNIFIVFIICCNNPVDLSRDDIHFEANLFDISGLLLVGNRELNP